MTASILLDHVLISVVALSLGVILGSGCGYLLALAIRAMFVSPRSRNLAILMPWRTVVMGLLLVIRTSINIVLWFGLGTVAAIASTGGVIFLLALPFTVSILLDQWYPSSQLNRFIAGIRTLATASPVIVPTVAAFTGGGMGFLILEMSRSMKSDQVIQAYLIVIIMILAFDLLFGAFELALSRRFCISRDEKTDKSNTIQNST